MNNKHRLENTLTNLKDFRKSLSEFSTPPSQSGWHLSNLPTHFWETLGECINDIEEFIKIRPINKEDVDEIKRNVDAEFN